MKNKNLKMLNYFESAFTSKLNDEYKGKTSLDIITNFTEFKKYIPFNTKINNNLITKINYINTNLKNNINLPLNIIGKPALNESNINYLSLITKFNPEVAKVKNTLFNLYKNE